MNGKVERANELNSELELRFRECLLERTRIASGLHDTLLQGFLCASIELHAVLEQIPEDSTLKSPVSRVLGLMHTAIGKGRTAIQDFRSGCREFSSLEQGFAALQYDLELQFATRFRIFIDGSAQANEEMCEPGSLLDRPGSDGECVPAFRGPEP